MFQQSQLSTVSIHRAEDLKSRESLSHLDLALGTGNTTNGLWTLKFEIPQNVPIQ